MIWLHSQAPATNPQLVYIRDLWDKGHLLPTDFANPTELADWRTMSRGRAHNLIQLGIERSKQPKRRKKQAKQLSVTEIITNKDGGKK